MTDTLVSDTIWCYEYEYRYMNRRNINTLILGCLTALITLYGCKEERQADLHVAGTTQSSASGRSASLFAPKSAYPGKLIFKVSEGLLGDIKLVDAGGMQMSSMPTAMSAAFGMMKANKVERLVLPSGKYEGALKEAGLDRWFVVTFDEEVALTDAFAIMNNVGGIETVEYSCQAEVFEAPQGESPVYDFIRSGELPFDDPMLSQQWHYNNLGDKYWAKQGCDINLFNAWKITTGTPNVIVCVVDGGIDVTHPDLKDNLWVNKAEEKNGIDDDGNGRKDDIHGFCFVDLTGDIRPDADGHGTHVAGTVGARSNNGIGVSGVAGGNHKDLKETGVRIMSAAILRANPDGVTTKGASAENIANAIIYGALNGATISQNSWGYPFASGVEQTPTVVKEAIDFFIDKAGTVLDTSDPRYGQQREDAPMKGGVVFFAAGNDNVDFPTPPASYERVVAVAAIAPNFTKASYSTYGNWVDISAPGGDMQRYGEKAGVLSTMAPDMKPKALYHYYHGTSMACPHVSGVAALVLSKFGGPGFTNEDLKTRILASVLPIDLDKVNPTYAGKLGVGTIDAYAAVTLVNNKKAPEKPVFIAEKSTKNAFTELTLYWNVPKDEDDKQPLRYKLYVSDKELTKDNYMRVGDVSGTANGFISGSGTEPGDEMSFTVPYLKPGQAYHFALVAYDKWGNISEPSLFVGETKTNHAPEITNLPQEPLLVIDTNHSYLLEIEEKDGHSWTYEISGDRGGVTHKKTSKGIELTIRPVLGEGEHICKLTLKDELGLAKTFDVPFRVVHVQTPVMKTTINSLLVGVKSGPLELALPDFFEKQYYLTLSFKAVSTKPSVASTFIDKDGRLFIIGENSGNTSVVITASNGYKSISTTIEVKVTEDVTDDVLSVWPLPVERVLNIWLHPKHKRAEVKVQSINGELILHEAVKANTVGITSVDLRTLNPGSYVLVIKTGEKESVRSILKR